ncbi:ankyrin repeat protein [Fusarium oxysporum f. sp. phaseoli]
MADPLSIAASIAGILALAGTVIHKTYRYGSDVKGAPDDIANFLRELTITTGLLTALKALAKNDAQTKTKNLTSNGALASICGKHGSPETVLFLIEKGADVHQPVSHVGTAIQAAMAERRFDILEVLLQNSGDVCESKGRYGTVLHLAVEQRDIDNEDVVQLLLRHGAEAVINALVPNSGSALHHAIVWNSSPRVVELLLDKVADPNLESGPSTNPLHRAILENSVGTVEILIERGATGHSKYGPYVSALECAAYAGHEHLFRKILKFNSTKPRTSTDLSRTLQRAIVGGHFSILGQALQEGGNAQDQDEHRWNPYVCALHVKSDRTMKLLEQGQGLRDAIDSGIVALSPTGWDFEKLPECYRSLIQSEDSKLQFSGTWAPAMV